MRMYSQEEGSAGAPATASYRHMTVENTASGVRPGLGSVTCLVPVTVENVR